MCTIPVTCMSTFMLILMNMNISMIRQMKAICMSWNIMAMNIPIVMMVCRTHTVMKLRIPDQNMTPGCIPMTMGDRTRMVKMDRFIITMKQDIPTLRKRYRKRLKPSSISTRGTV